MITKLRRLWHSNSLSIVLLTIFMFALIGMSIAGWRTAVDDARQHQQSTPSYGQYISSGEFIEGVFENWESEFLQMWALVMLTIWLRQKGSSDSKPLRGKSPQDTSSRYAILKSANWRTRSKAIGHALYAHSLGLVLLAIFVVSFTGHAVGGAAAYNQSASYHGSSERVSVLSFIATSEFWYQSLQNWQSEFLAVGTLILLSIKLRERGSPESKPVGVAEDSKTGS